MSELADTMRVEALDLLDQGLSVDEVVARFPNDAAELRPFLMMATALSKMATLPSVAAKQDSRRAFLAAADAAAAQPARSAGRSAPWLMRLVSAALAALAVIFIGGAGLVAASASAVPGDALYTTKRFVEETQLRLASDPERAAALLQRFERERVSEVERLLAEGRAADVRFVGTIEALNGDRWTVAGLPVDVAAATVDGAPGLGAQVEVVGRTEGGVVVADQIMILTALPEQDEEMPPAVETPRPTPTPQPTRDNSNSNDAGDDEEYDDSDNDNSNPGAPGAAPTLRPSVTLPAPTPAPPTPVPPTPVPPTSEPPPPPPPPTATPDDDNDNGNDNDGGSDNDNANDNDNGSGNDNDDPNDNDDNSGPGGGNDDGGDNGNENDNSPPPDDNSNDNNDGGDDNNDNGDDNDNNG